MGMRKLFVLLMPILLSSTNLVLTDGRYRRVVQSMRGADITPIDYFDQGMLVLATQAGCRLLENADVDYRILDPSYVPGTCFLIWARPGLSSPLSVGRELAATEDMRLVCIENAGDVDRLASSGHEIKQLLSTPLPDVVVEKERSFAGITKDTIIQEMANQVTWDSILGCIRRLQNFRTRYSSTDSARACARWLTDRFRGYGFDSVYTDTFSATYAPNVIAVKKGMVYPGRSYVVGCGHYDCTSGSPTTFAPGANDDGTGTAMALEAARVLRNYRFEYSIRLIGFGGEEQGLLGSADYALKAYNRRDTIRGVINGDMFGYTTPNRDTLMVINDTTYRSNLSLANYFAACADTYTTLKKRVWTGRRAQSDHASFSRQGFTAIQERENLNVSNPYYHTIGDTIGGGLNAYTMVYQGVRAAVATIASLAIPYRTAVAEQNQARPGLIALEVMPNPAYGRVVLKVRLAPGRTGERAELRIYDVLGQLKYSCGPRESDDFVIEVGPGSGLGPGVYLIRAASGAASFTKKLVVMH